MSCWMVIPAMGFINSWANPFLGPSAKLPWLCFLSWVILFGVDGYMFERWKRTQPYRPLLMGIEFLFVLPFRYLKLGLQEKDLKAPLVFGVHWLLLAAAIWLMFLGARS